VINKQEFEDDLPSGSAVIMSNKSPYGVSEVFTWLEAHYFPGSLVRMYLPFLKDIHHTSEAMTF
jgi:hypothetical protein